MNQPTAQPRCSTCGANLSLDDLRGSNCRYCGTALPHQARAAEQAALVNQMLNQQFQARGLAVPTSPVVPYQYGAPPVMPAMPPLPQGMTPYGADVAGAARNTVAIVVVVSVVVLAFGVMILGAVLFLAMR